MDFYLPIMPTFLPRKRFGQHFLQDKHVVSQIIQAIAPSPDYNFVEIGPGKGALTFELLKHVEHLSIIELDRDLVSELEPQLASYPHLTLYSADALKFNFLQLINGQPLHIVGNLPYNISTSLIFHLLNFASHVGKMTFMLQKEVVDRMVALPNSKSYGRLSVILQYFFYVQKLFDVPPEAFNPPPKVDSSIVQLTPHTVVPVQVMDFKVFNQVVSQAFSQRRKTLRNTLKHWLTAEEMESIDIDPYKRAEALNLESFAKLANLFTQNHIYIERELSPE